MYLSLTEFEKQSDFMDNLSKLKDGEPLCVVIDTSWGTISSAYLYAHLISLEAEQRKVSVIWLYVQSSWFHLFYMLRDNPKIQRFVPKFCYGMVHMPAWSVPLWNKGVSTSDISAFQKRCQEEQNENYPFLTGDVQIQYANGRDIYITGERMAQICRAEFIDDNFFQTPNKRFMEAMRTPVIRDIPFHASTAETINNMVR